MTTNTTDQPTETTPDAPSEDVLAALDSGDYCRVGRIAQNDPAQFCARVKHPYEPELEPLFYWQNRAAAMASGLVAERVAAQVQAARAEVWREVIAALTTARSVSAVAVWAAARLAQATPADAAEVTA